MPAPRASRQYWRSFAGYGLWLLVPALLFGMILALLVERSATLAPSIALGALAGLAGGLFIPSRNQRRARTRQAWTALGASQRER